MLKLLQPVSEEKLGYSYGKPLRVDEKSLAVVLPILRETSLNRQYITFPETDKVLVFDTGKIDEMEADNQTAENVFIRSGTLFRGSTQERALQRSAVLFPGKKSKLGVRCVHASRGINPNAGVKYGGITPLDFDASNYSHGYSFKDQASTWQNVMKTTSNMSQMMGNVQQPKHSMIGGIISPMYMSSMATEQPIGSAENIQASAFTSAKADDLHSSFNEFAKHFDEILSKVKMVQNQAGLALITHAGVQTVEFFDHLLSWKALHESAVKRLGSSIIDKGDENVFDYKPDAAIKQVNRVLGLDFKTNRIWEHRPNNGEPKVEITGLTADGYVGEAVEIDERLIHLVILKQAA